MEMTLLKWYTAVQLMPAVLARHGWIVLALLALVALLGRRVYCRFVCPLGIAQSLVRGFMGKRRICSRLDRANAKSPVRLAVRVAVLAAFVVAGIAGLGWQWLDPYAIASRAAVAVAEVCKGGEVEVWATALFALVPAAVILLLAILAGGRIWCNWACPVGTLLSLVGIRPLKGDKVKKCAGCEKCRKCMGKD